VPVAYFQALGKTERDSHTSDGRPTTANQNPDHDSGYGEVNSAMQSPGSSASASQRMSKSAKQGAMVYGVVMYDFNAERSDELEAKAGEAIIVIAQSNPEWFVAKPIGRLGGPGLIPVSFIELRDMATGKALENPGEAIRKAGVPKVEEWKKMATAYKNSSITLGKFEGGGPSQPLEQGMERLSIQNAPQVSCASIIPSISLSFLLLSSQPRLISLHLSSPQTRLLSLRSSCSTTSSHFTIIVLCSGSCTFQSVPRLIAPPSPQSLFTLTTSVLPSLQPMVTSRPKPSIHHPPASPLDQALTNPNSP
jgi:hypothetical protein